MRSNDERNMKIIDSSVIEEVAEAMKQGQIVPYFQPKYNYAARQWCGAEALVRWIHPEHGFLPLDFLIPIFEKTGQITQLDLYMLEQVCMYQQRWKELSIPVLQVSVNFSQRNFDDPGFAQRVMDILKHYQTGSQEIRFEITETSYVLCENNIKAFIGCVHEKGFCVDMDDFGSGYSSLGMLNETCVDSIKLDMNMIRKAGRDSRCDHILRATVQLVNELGIDVLAEGVETKAQADFLLEIGCKYMQGFYFSRPLSLLAYQQLLEDRERQDASEMAQNQSIEGDNGLPEDFRQAYEKYKKYTKQRRSDSKTGHTGVSMTPEGKYRADITFEGKRYFLGKFNSLDAAVAARKQAEKLNDEFFDEYYVAHPKALRKAP